jgi:hypothetical protein
MTKLTQLEIILYGLLDDIDTASDMFKPVELDFYIAFYNYTMKKVNEKSKYIESDGYNLYHK